MPAFAIALVSLLVLPASVGAPMYADAQTLATTTVASSTPVSSYIAAASGAKATSVPLTVKLTAYNAVPAQTDGNPFVTASGAFSNPEVVAARSNDLAGALPFGTVIEITRAGADSPMCNFGKVSDQIGYRVIADSMNTRIHNTVDVLLDQNNTVKLNGHQINPGRALGLCGGTSIRIVGHLKISDIPDTQDQLAALVAPQEQMLADAKF